MAPPSGSWSATVSGRVAAMLATSVAALASTPAPPKAAPPKLRQVAPSPNVVDPGTGIAAARRSSAHELQMGPDAPRKAVGGDLAILATPQVA
jgi:hypothetical protein